MSSPTDVPDENRSATIAPKHEHGHLETVYSENTIDAGYFAKAQILNEAVQNIGIGRYQLYVQQILRYHG